jgi:hypothetical protein
MEGLKIDNTKPAECEACPAGRFETVWRGPDLGGSLEVGACLR